MLLKANPASRELLDLPRETLERMGQQAGRLELNVLVGLLKTFSAVDYNLKVSPYVQLPLELAVMESLLSRGATQPAMQPVQVQPVTPVQQPQPQPIKPVAPAQPPVVASRQTAANIRPVNSVTSAEENEPPLDIEPPADYPEEYRAKSAPKVEPKTAELASQKSKIPAKAVEAPATPTVATPTVSKPEPGIPETVINFEEVQKLWPRLREVIGLSQKMVQALLADARPVRVEGKHIIIAFKYQFHCEKVSQERTRAMVEENYSKLLGYTTYIRCVLEGQFEPTNSDGGANRNKAEAKSAPVIDERSRAAARIFNATIQDFD
jgi:DNA polymerase-3 subunit gamma/tau